MSVISSEATNGTQAAASIAAGTTGRASHRPAPERSFYALADGVKLVIEGAGHWLMEEAPDQVIPVLVGFLDK